MGGFWVDLGGCGADRKLSDDRARIAKNKLVLENHLGEGT